MKEKKKKVNCKKQTPGKTKRDKGGKGGKGAVKRINKKYLPKGGLKLKLQVFNFQKFKCNVVRDVLKREERLNAGWRERLERARTTFVD